MAGNNSLILDKLQAGIEASRGVAVPTTRKLYMDASGSYDRELAEFTDKSGTFEARRRPAYARGSASFSGTDVGTFEDLPWHLKHAVKGGVVGVSDGATGNPAFAYGFLPSLAADDLDTSTVEFNHEGNVYRSRQLIVNSWTLRGDSDSNDEPAWMYEAEYLALDWEPVANYTPGVPDRETEVVPARGTIIKVADTAAGLAAAAPLSGKLISWSFSGNNNVELKAYAENVSGYAAGKVGRGARTLNAQFTFEFDDDVEFAKYRSNVPAQRAVRMESAGSPIHGAQAGPPAIPAATKLLRADVLGYWSSISFGNRAQSKTATFDLAAYYDATLAKSFSFDVVNALSALP